MAKTSFNKTAPTDKQPEGPGPDPVGPKGKEGPIGPDSTAIVVREEQPLAERPPETPNQVEGEVDYTDINMDRINLVQKSGNLSNEFSPGGFVLGKEVVLAEKDNAFELVVLKIKKFYQEDLPYDASGSGPQPQRFNTAEEVRNAGGSLKYGDEAYYRDAATALVLIPAPEGITDEDRENKFIYEGPDGINYALALWTFSKTSYTSAAKRIFTAKLIGHLKTGLEKGLWKVSSEIKSNAGNSWYQPVFKPGAKTSPEFQAFANEVLTTLG